MLRHALSAYLATLLLLIGCGPSEFAPDAGNGGGTGPGGEFEPEPDAQVCDEARVAETQQKVPDVLLVVDRSGSMDNNLPDGSDKWDVMRQAIGELTGAKEGQMRFGLMMYPWDNSCDPGEVLVDIGDTTRDQIVALMGQHGATGKTPTEDSLKNARTYFAGRPANPDGHYVILATDGMPNCGDDDDAIDAVADLHGDGVSTYVLGYSFSSDTGVLQEMAQAGGTTSFYEANSSAELSTALDAIAGELRRMDCHFELSATPKDPAGLEITFDGQPVDATSWSYDAAGNAIDFTGDSCTMLETGQVEEVKVDFGCDGVVVL